MITAFVIIGAILVVAIVLGLTGRKSKDITRQEFNARMRDIDKGKKK
jgi:hypothetical protein